MSGIVVTSNDTIIHNMGPDCPALKQIFSYLNPKDLQNVLRVNSLWKDFVLECVRSQEIVSFIQWTNVIRPFPSFSAIPYFAKDKDKKEGKDGINSYLYSISQSQSLREIKKNIHDMEDKLTDLIMDPTFISTEDLRELGPFGFNNLLHLLLLCKEFLDLDLKDPNNSEKSTDFKTAFFKIINTNYSPLKDEIKNYLPLKDKIFFDKFVEMLTQPLFPCSLENKASLAKILSAGGYFDTAIALAKRTKSNKCYCEKQGLAFFGIVQSLLKKGDVERAVEVAEMICDDPFDDSCAFKKKSFIEIIRFLIKKGDFRAASELTNHKPLDKQISRELQLELSKQGSSKLVEAANSAVKAINLSSEKTILAEIKELSKNARSTSVVKEVYSEAKFEKEFFSQVVCLLLEHIRLEYICVDRALQIAREMQEEENTVIASFGSNLLVTISQGFCKKNDWNRAWEIAMLLSEDPKKCQELINGSTDLRRKLLLQITEHLFQKEDFDRIISLAPKFSASPKVSVELVKIGKDLLKRGDLERAVKIGKAIKEVEEGLVLWHAANREKHDLLAKCKGAN